jgi:hypothetical protein
VNEEPFLKDTFLDGTNLGRDNSALVELPSRD